MISASKLVKRYGDFNLDISMEVPDGYITGLVGKNGAGKSTTIKLILGLVRPDEGSITVLGKAPGSLERKDKENVVAIFFLAGKVMENTNISINGFVDKLNSMPYAVILLIIIAVAAGIMAASIVCSLAIMKKKEY